MDMLKTGRLFTRRRRRRLALFTAVSLMSGSLGLSAPGAETAKDRVPDFPESPDSYVSTASDAEHATPSDAAMKITCEIIDLGDTLTTAEDTASLFSLRDGQVDLAPGKHERWIDRVLLPDYAEDFYEMLVEGSDNDGVDDILIDAGYFSAGSAVTIGSTVFNGIRICQFTDENDLPYVQRAIRAAYDAFDRDHPEVFWLSGETRLSVVSDGSYRHTVYFLLKSHSGSNADFDIRASQYRSEAFIIRGIEKRDRQVEAILRSAAGESVKNQILHFNQWLTSHNEYNTTSSGNYPWASRECITALEGNTGTDGPVCEAYARGFKVLCDALDIPCVLVDGNANGPHMWNYAQVGGKWYAVDVTWNDPSSSKVHGAVSGLENTDWLLLGSDTLVKTGGKYRSFLDSHPVSNTASIGGVSFTNGPELSEEQYPLNPTPTVAFPSSSQIVTYTGQTAAVAAPTITVETEDGKTQQLAVTPFYSYQRSGTAAFTDGLPTDAGTYVIRAQIPASDKYNSASGIMTLTIQKAAPALSVSASYSRAKTYDGRPFGPPAAAQVAVAGASCSDVRFTWYQTTASGSIRLNAAPSDAGTYLLVSAIDETDNTRAVSVNTEIVIKRRKISIAADPASKFYKDPDPELTYRVVNGSLADGDSLKGSLSRQPGENVSPEGYRILQGSLTGENNPSYEISFLPETFTIQKAPKIPAPETAALTDHDVELKPLDLGNGGGSVLYGYSGSDDPDHVVLWQDSPRFSDLTPGTTYFFFIRVSGSANYADAWESVPVTTRKTALAVPAAQDYVYTGSRITVNMAGYSPELMAMTGAASGTGAGDYTLQFRLLDAGRYSWENQPDGADTVSVTWSIARKPVTVKAADKTRTVSRDNPELTLETPADGVLTGDDKIDDLGVTLSTTARRSSPAGTYPITGTASPDTNYLVTIQPGTLTITRSGGSSSGGGSGSGSGGGSGSGSASLTAPNPGSGASGSWSLDGGRWRFLRSSGSYAAGRMDTGIQGNTVEFISWQLINSVWWAFGADGFAKEGWILDAGSNLWYSVDINSGMRTGWYRDGSDSNWYYLEPSGGHMLTGWQLVGGAWYYLNPVSQAGRPLGAMYHNERTPDGYFVREDGRWTGQ